MGYGDFTVCGQLFDAHRLFCAVVHAIHGLSLSNDRDRKLIVSFKIKKFCFTVRATEFVNTNFINRALTPFCANFISQWNCTVTAVSLTNDNLAITNLDNHRGHFQRAIGILLSQTRQVVLNFREFPVSLTQASGTCVKARDDVQMRRVHNKTIAQTTTDTIFF